MQSAQEEPSGGAGLAAVGEGHAEKEILRQRPVTPEAVAEIPAGVCAETAEASQEGSALRPKRAGREESSSEGSTTSLSPVAGLTNK
ncbi:MAG: hypothetical protein ACLR76_02190 [Alistipes sp.]